MNQGLETLSCTFPLLNSFKGVQPCSHMTHILDLICIAPDKAVYCVFTQFRGPENAIKFFSVRTKTQ